MTDIQLANKIAKRVNELGGKTFFVGGYVRDKIIGIENKDIDIEIHEIFPDVLRDLLSEFGIVKTQGVSFGVYNIKGFDIDIAQPRMESVTGRGHKDFEVTVDPFIGTKKASIRRDFTMNAIMEDVLTGEIIDHFNGVNDIHNKIIRHVDDITFSEDPLRVLRAAQFAARFNFTIASDTLRIMKNMDLSALSKERIYSEMNKALLKSNKPSIFFNVLRKVNQLHQWFPEVRNLIDCQQNPKYHPEGDVWNHTMNVIDAAAKLKNEASNPEYFMVSALCHDFGKPLTTKINDKGIIQSIGHEEKGVEITAKFLHQLNSDVNLTKYVLNMVVNHSVLHNTFNNNAKIKTTNAKFDISICPRDLVLLTIADSNGKNKNEEEAIWIRDRLHIYEARMKEPEVTGQDLINLGLKPGPEFSKILEMTHKQHLSGVPKEKVLKGVITQFMK